MEFIGTAFSITLGAWRLRLKIALEEANDDLAAPAGKMQRRVDARQYTRVN